MDQTLLNSHSQSKTGTLQLCESVARESFFILCQSGRFVCFSDAFTLHFDNRERLWLFGLGVIHDVKVVEDLAVDVDVDHRDIVDIWLADSQRSPRERP
jgi:hypothetical protein